MSFAILLTISIGGLRPGYNVSNKNIEKIMETKKILKWPLIIGIVIVLNMFFLYAVKVAYPEPEYDDFCGRVFIAKPMNVVRDVTDCEILEVPVEFQESCSENKGYIEYDYDSNGSLIKNLRSPNRSGI